MSSQRIGPFRGLASSGVAEIVYTPGSAEAPEIIVDIDASGHVVSDYFLANVIPNNYFFRWNPADPIHVAHMDALVWARDSGYIRTMTHVVDTTHHILTIVFHYPLRVGDNHNVTRVVFAF